MHTKLGPGCTDGSSNPILLKKGTVSWTLNDTAKLATLRKLKLLFKCERRGIGFHCDPTSRVFDNVSRIQPTARMVPSMIELWPYNLGHQGSCIASGSRIFKICE